MELCASYISIGIEGSYFPIVIASTRPPIPAPLGGCLSNRLGEEYNYPPDGNTELRAGRRLGQLK